MLDSEKEKLFSLLESVECQEYISLFEKNDITVELFTSLDKYSLKELGVNKVGDRLRLQILIHVLKLEKIKQHIPKDLLNKSIDIAANSITQLDQNVKSQRISQSIKSFTIGIIMDNGDFKNISINGLFNNGNEIRQKIFLGLGLVSEGWRIYYVDYEKSNSDLTLVDDAALVDFFNSSQIPKETGRFIICQSHKSVSIESINTSNKIHRGRNERNSHNDNFEQNTSERNIHPFMGGRPPSQLISGNLREYFPDLDNREIKDIKRKSLLMSMYSNKMMNKMNKGVDSEMFKMNRDSLYSRLSHISVASSRMSMISEASYGIGKPLAIHKPGEVDDSDIRNNQDDEKIEDEQPYNVIELLDDDDDDEYEENNENNDQEIMSIINAEVNNGPSIWHKGPKIGQGSFGNVYLGLNGLTGELMAIKQVDLPSNETEQSKRIMVNALKQEISLLKELTHDHIVRYLGSNEDSSNMYIFLEYIPGGSVSSMLKMYGPFEEELIRNFTKQVLIGLTYLHGKGIIHRDIKGGNILVDNNGNVKIGDFGISKKTTQEEEEKLNEESKNSNKRSSLQGSVFWMAPEVVKQVAYTSKADVWSVGCLVIEMYTGKHPYPGLSPMQALFQIGTGRAQPAVPERANKEDTGSEEFFEKVFTKDYTLRSSAHQLLELKFLKV